MTERTVTVQTEEEHEIAICDHCGTDERPPDELRSFVGEDDDPTLHYHVSCLDEMGIRAGDLPRVADFVRRANDTNAKNPSVAFVFRTVDVVFCVVGAVFIVGGYFAPRPINFIAYAWGIVLIAIIVLHSHLLATKTVEEMIDG